MKIGVGMTSNEPKVDFESTHSRRGWFSLKLWWQFREVICMRRTCWLLFTLFLIGSLPGWRYIGCSNRYPIESEMESWINHPISELIAAWGEPAKIVPSQGGSDYIWIEDTRNRVFNEKRFWVNEKGIILQWYIAGPGTLAPGAQK